MSSLDINVIKEFVQLTDSSDKVAIDANSGDNITIDNDCNTVTVSDTIQNISIADAGSSVVIKESEIQTVEINNTVLFGGPADYGIHNTLITVPLTVLNEQVMINRPITVDSSLGGSVDVEPGGEVLILPTGLY